MRSLRGSLWASKSRRVLTACICGVYEAHERVIRMLEAGAPLCLDSQCILDEMAATLVQCGAQGLRVGAQGEVEAVLACAKRIYGYNPEWEISLAMTYVSGVDRQKNVPEARRLLGIAASRGNAEASRMRC